MYALFIGAVHLALNVFSTSPVITYDCYGRLHSETTEEGAFAITITPGIFYGSAVIEMADGRKGTGYRVSRSEDFYRLTRDYHGAPMTIVIDRNSGYARISNAGSFSDFKCDKTPRHRP